MTPSLPAAPATTPTALSAFLRGIQRRGAVLAQLQAGNPEAGDAALAAAMHAFRAGASTQTMAQWPQRFWTLLLATPQLRGNAAIGREDETAAWLSRLDAGARAALLLRLVAGLSETDAAEVLAVSLSDFRKMLHRALPRHDDGRADPAAWQQLREQLHRRIKTLPDTRLAQLERMREAALDATPAARHAHPQSLRRCPRWVMVMLWILLAICAAAFAATYAWPQLSGWWQSYRDPTAIRREALPPAPPATRFDAETALLTHRDFELLADPQGMAASRELAFFSWLAAQPPAVGDDATEQDDAAN